MIRALAVAALLAGCGGNAAIEQADNGPESATFDVATVIATFEQECPTPIVVDELFCQQVEVDGITGDGESLVVPTLLAPDATDRARVICEQFAEFRFDADAVDLGYEVVGILDRDGGNAAACSV